MDLHFSITVFGLLIASGFANEQDPKSNHAIPGLKDYEAQRNAAVAVYQRLAENKTQKNIALSVADVLIGLAVLDAAIGSEPEVSWFRNFYHVDSNTAAAADRYMKIMALYDVQRSDEITFYTHYLIRESCAEPDNDSLTTDKTDYDYRNKYTFSDMKDAVRSLDEWYNEQYVYFNFDPTEFWGEECIIAFGGGYFCHDWQQSDICLVRSKYFFMDGTYEPEIKYTRVIDNFPGYGELPELNARYIEVPWTSDYGDIGLYVVLPNAVDGLLELEKKITGDTIRKMVNEATETKLNVTLPEFVLSRKYHLMSLMAEDPTATVSDDFADLVNAVEIEVFESPSENCSLSGEPQNRRNYDLPQFNANHPFLILIVYQGDGTGNDSFILGMASHRVPEQWPYLSYDMIND